MVDHHIIISNITRTQYNMTLPGLASKVHSQNIKKCQGLGLYKKKSTNFVLHAQGSVLWCKIREITSQINEVILFPCLVKTLSRKCSLLLCVCISVCLNYVCEAVYVGSTILCICLSILMFMFVMNMISSAWFVTVDWWEQFEGVYPPQLQ